MSSAAANKLCQRQHWIIDGIFICLSSILYAVSMVTNIPSNILFKNSFNYGKSLELSVSTAVILQHFPVTDHNGKIILVLESRL